MKKFYQTEWHGIPFNSFARLSSKELADAAFYAAFYAKFFEKYRDWSDLRPDWVKLKLQAMDHIAGHKAFRKDIKALSIGCGLGIMEKALLDAGYENLELTEVSDIPLRWVLTHFDKEKVHIGFFPECLPHDRFYDFIFLSGVEYFFDQKELIKFLKAVKGRLRPGGTCLMISWSYEFKAQLAGLPSRVVNTAKKIAYSLLAFFKLKPAIRSKPKQFWGYLRHRGDFREAMKAAGFIQLKDGFLEKKTNWDTYFIEGISGGGK